MKKTLKIDQVIFSVEQVKADAIIRLRQEKIEQFMKMHKGYYRHLAVDAQSLLRYEADDEDIDFLTRLFKEHFKNQKSDALAKNDFVMDYNLIVPFIEQSPNYKEFELFNIERELKRPEEWKKTFDASISKYPFFTHWSNKCTRFKRLLSRDKWRFAEEEKFFGPHPRRYTAFPQPQRKVSRNTTLKPSEEFYRKLEEIKASLTLAMDLAILTERREEMKFIRARLDLFSNREIPANYLAHFQKLLKNISETEADLKKRLGIVQHQPPVVEAVQHVRERPEVAPPSSRAAHPPAVDNDVVSFILSLSTLLEQKKINIGDFQKKNVQNINKTIRNIKSSEVNIKLDRKVSLSDLAHQSSAESISRPLLVKRVVNPSREIFLSKVLHPNFEEITRTDPSIVLYNSGAKQSWQLGLVLERITSSGARANSIVAQFERANLQIKQHPAMDMEFGTLYEVDKADDLEESFKEFVKAKMASA